MCHVASEPPVLAVFKVLTALEINSILDCHRSGKRHPQPHMILLLLLEKKKKYRNGWLFYLGILRKPNQPTLSSNPPPSERFLACPPFMFISATSFLLTILLVPGSLSSASFLPVIIVNILIVFPSNDVLFNFNYYL